MNDYDFTSTEKAKQQFELLKLEFERSLDQRKFEIDNFWKRGWFFGALLLAIAALYFQAKDDYKSYRIYIAFIGLCISFFQGLMIRGSKYWQERWEAKTKRRESLLGIDLTNTRRHLEREKYFLDAGILAKAENFLVRGSRYSVSKLTLLIWDLVTLSWLMVWMANWPLSKTWCLVKLINDHPIRWIHGVYLFYIARFWIKGKVWQPFLTEIKDDNGRYNTIALKHSERYLKGDQSLDDLVSEELTKNIGKPLSRWQRFLRDWR